VEICLTDSTANCVQVEFDIGRRVLTQRTEQISPHFRSRGTAQAGALPDFTDRISSLIAMANDHCHSGLQRRIGSQLVLELCHATCRQQFVEPRGNFAISPLHEFVPEEGSEFQSIKRFDRKSSDALPE
jgi:hypothetical protein